MKVHLLPLAFFALLSGASAAADEEPGASWVSIPRSLVTIDVTKRSGRVTGPGWEYAFPTTARRLDFEIEPGRRVVLRRNGEVWVGEYFHPRIRPGTHKFEQHKMKFVCSSGRCDDGN